MNLTKLIISPQSLGEHLILTDIMPAFEYKDGKKTNNIPAHRYTVAMPTHGFDKISVRIEGKQQLSMPEDYPEVTFDDLELRIYWTPNGHQLSARATGIRLVSDGKTAKA